MLVYLVARLTIFIIEAVVVLMYLCAFAVTIWLSFKVRHHPAQVVAALRGAAFVCNSWFWRRRAIRVEDELCFGDEENLSVDVDEIQ